MLLLKEVGDEEIKKVREEAERRKPPLLVYVDLETVQETGEHVPNLVCWQTKNDDDNDVANERGAGCIERFLHVLPEMRKDFSLTVIFHNLKGFDGQFIMREAYEMGLSISKVVSVGMKVMTLDVTKKKEEEESKKGIITFKDSLCFIASGPREFSSMFGLDPDRFEKGHCPHLFNTEANQEYEGPIPDKKFFFPETMSDRKQFDQWYDEEAASGRVRIAQNGLISSIIHKALARDMQITETSSGPTIAKEKRHFAESDEEICHLLTFPNAKYKDTAGF